MMDEETTSLVLKGTQAILDIEKIKVDSELTRIHEKVLAALSAQAAIQTKILERLDSLERS